MIEVRLFASLREGRQKILFLDAHEYRKVSEVLDHLNIRYKEVSLYLINGRHSKLDDKINEGDVLAFFPPVGGG